MDLKLNIQEVMTSGPITSQQVEGEKVETVIDFFLCEFQKPVDGDCSHDI